MCSSVVAQFSSISQKRDLARLNFKSNRKVNYRLLAFGRNLLHADSSNTLGTLNFKMHELF